MLDFVGNQLEIGDDVVFTEYTRHGMTRGTVIGFSKTLSMVTIEYVSSLSGSLKKTKKTSGYVVKVVK